MNFMSLPIVLRIALAIFGLAVVLALTVFAKTPRNDRRWAPGLERLATFFPSQQNPDHWRLQNRRIFEFGKDGPVGTGWDTIEIDPEALSEIWFFVEPFPGNQAFGHTFLSFVFDGDEPQTLSVSVEARREEGEVYSPFSGLFGAYELSYVWSTEKDILTRIIVHLEHDVYAHRLRVNREDAEAILHHFIKRTNRLAEHPRFYNSLFSNCTNELVKGVDAAMPGLLRWHYSFILTGKSAQHLRKLGFIDGADKPFQALADNANISASVRQSAELDAASFATGWRRVQDFEKTVLPD